MDQCCSAIEICQSMKWLFIGYLTKRIFLLSVWISCCWSELQMRSSALTGRSCGDKQSNCPLEEKIVEETHSVLVTSLFSSFPSAGFRLVWLGGSGTELRYCF